MKTPRTDAQTKYCCGTLVGVEFAQQLEIENQQLIKQVAALKLYISGQEDETTRLQNEIRQLSSPLDMLKQVLEQHRTHQNANLTTIIAQWIERNQQPKPEQPGYPEWLEEQRKALHEKLNNEKEKL